MKHIYDQRIQKQHLERKAIVYVRQSSPGQVRNNRESTRIQLGLREKAIEHGFRNPVIIDDDLGISAAGFEDRPGFRRLLSEVAMRQVGIILSIDVSRLSRNSKDWANLLELCAHFDTLIADHEQVYDLSQPNDRLVLGIKGTVSEMELTILKNRLKSGAEAKAARGELKFIVPPGYTHDHDSRIILDPDKRVQHAIAQMFDQFDRSSSMRQLAMWYRDTNTLFPVRQVRKTRITSWEIPSSNTLRKLLQHPIYAGVYTYGRRKDRTEFRDGKLIKRTEQYLKPEECRVCIFDSHPEYISWDRYQINQGKIAECRPRRKMQDNRGPIRDGVALLAGMLRCGHCGGKMAVSYKKNSALYYCDQGQQIKGERRCLSFGSKMIDTMVAGELCLALSPIAIEASLHAAQKQGEEWEQSAKNARLRVQAAQYEVDRAFEQFDLADPRNRLVTDALEERLNQKLIDLNEAKEHLDEVQNEKQQLSEEQQKTIDKLARDFPLAWNHPNADNKIKKMLLRKAIKEIIVLHQPDNQRIEATIHWQGGVHTRIHVRKRATPVGSKTDPSLIETVQKLRSLSDEEIARILNMKKIRTPRDLKWSKDRVTNFRRANHIRAIREHDRDKYMTGQQVAEVLGVSRHGVEALIRVGALNNHQITEFAPWRIPREEVESDEVKRLVKILKNTGRIPNGITDSENQCSLFPESRKNEKRSK
ncbi:MAG: recombinase family protein [Proteobacteria bacterium]|nr:recombinase family protein [Pseudomonadota bacterium]